MSTEDTEKSKKLDEVGMMLYRKLCCQGGVMFRNADSFRVLIVFLNSFISSGAERSLINREIVQAAEYQVCIDLHSLYLGSQKNPSTMAQSYKTLKENFVSNLSGGIVSEINWVTAVAPVSLSRRNKSFPANTIILDRISTMGSPSIASRLLPTVQSASFPRRFPA